MGMVSVTKRPEDDLLISIAIIPAAGQSLRMKGKHKLLLPWCDRMTVIDAVLNAWTRSQVSRIVMVIRDEDQELKRANQRWKRVEAVSPKDVPREMKDSIQCALDYIGGTMNLTKEDRWLVAPADLPTLDSRCIDRVLESSRRAAGIVIPRYQGRRGHPVSFPWSLAEQVQRLAPHQSIKDLFQQAVCEYVEFPDDPFPSDVDTPDDYANQMKRHRP